jgi:hypothetical protein
MKPDSLYNYGMKPWVKSKTQEQDKSIGWHRDWTDISYTRNEILLNRLKLPPENMKSNSRLAQYYFFTLSFTYELKYDNDEVSFAHAIPYTYNDHLQPFLNEIGQEKKYHSYLRIGTLCKTLARNDWKMLTITDKVKSYRDCNQELKWYVFYYYSYRMAKSPMLRNQIRNVGDMPNKSFYNGKNSKMDRELKLKQIVAHISSSPIKRRRRPNKVDKSIRMMNKHANKKGIVITSRVHPGEAQSSWVMQGLVEFLLSDDPVADRLRHDYVIKIIPMLNPDGVIYGNYRCSLLGFDLNRRWLDPNKHLDPTIYFTKRMMKVFQEECEIQFFCDLHGHSRKKNAFMYGCTFDNNKYCENINLKAFPAILSDKNEFFNYKGWSFNCEKSKEKTGRIVWFKELGIKHSFTQESTFYGRDRNESDTEDTDLHMTVSDFMQLGVDLAKTLSYYNNFAFWQQIITETKNYE